MLTTFGLGAVWPQARVVGVANVGRFVHDLRVEGHSVQHLPGGACIHRDLKQEDAGLAGQIPTEPFGDEVRVFGDDASTWDDIRVHIVILVDFRGLDSLPKTVTFEDLILITLPPKPHTRDDPRNGSRVVNDYWDAEYKGVVRCGPAERCDRVKLEFSLTRLQPPK